MNRHERRRQAKIGRQNVSGRRAYLDLHCVGPHSNPKTDCDLRILVPMPFDMEELRTELWKEGWFVTMTSPPGEGVLSCTAVCGSCAEKLLPPEPLAEARRIMNNRNNGGPP